MKGQVGVMKKTANFSIKLLALILVSVLALSTLTLTASAVPEDFSGGVRYDNITWNRGEMATNVLGVAKRFNGFFFENFEGVVDCEGAVAVGGNLVNVHPNGYSIGGVFPYASGSNENYTSFDARLIVAGDITGTASTCNVMGGHIVTGAASQITNFRNGSTVLLKPGSNGAEVTELKKLTDYYSQNSKTMFSLDNGSSQVTVFSKDTLRLTEQQIYGNSTQLSAFFSSAKADLTARSQILSEKTQTSGTSITVDWHTFVFNCVKDQVNIFNLDLTTAAPGSYLAKIGQSDPMNIVIDGGLTFENLGNGSAVVNLKVKDNAKITTRWASWGIDKSQKILFGQVLINIPNPASIHHESHSIEASFLAPQTDIFPYGGGHIYGSVVAKSLKMMAVNGFELHNFGLKNFTVPGLPVPTDPPASVRLGWMRSSELPEDKFLMTVGGSEWTYSDAFSKTPIKYFENESVRGTANTKASQGAEFTKPFGEQLVGIEHIWDAGTYFGTYKDTFMHRANDWASWLHTGESGNTENKGEYSIRRFSAYIDIPESQFSVISTANLAPVDELNQMSYLFPVNDNVFVFVNGTLAYWGGTDIVAGGNQYGALNRTEFMGKAGIPVRNGVNGVFKDMYPFTDGWCIDLEANSAEVNIKSLLKPGFNRIDIFTDEYWEGGGMNRVDLFFGTTK